MARPSPLSSRARRSKKYFRDAKTFCPDRPKRLTTFPAHRFRVPDRPGYVDSAQIRSFHVSSHLKRSPQRGYRRPTVTSDCQTRFRLLKRNKIAGDVRTAWGETSLSVPECGHAVTGHLKIECELGFKNSPFLGLFWHLNHYRRPVRTPNQGYQSDQNSSRELVEVWACGRRNAVAAFPCRAR